MFRKLFIGNDGLRAGWSLLIFLALMAALLKGLSVITAFLHVLPPKDANKVDLTPGFAFSSESAPLLATFIVTWIMSKIERRPTSVYGLGGKRPLPNFAAALAWGMACLSLLVFTLWSTGLLIFDGRLLFGAEILHYGVLWLLLFLMVGLIEEYLTRGYLLFTLTRGLAGIYSSV